MTKLVRVVVLGVVGAGFLTGHVRAYAQAGAGAAADGQAVAGQAPEEATKKITELVRAGKYAEAQQLVGGLLIAYPNDERLTKAKALIEKLSAAPVTAASGSVGSGETLTGMDKVDYSALIVLAKQAQQNTDLAEQRKQLQQYMAQSAVFLEKHPKQMLLWQLRAAAAISLNEPTQGYEAGQQLLALGASESNDANLLQLLGQLKNLGWLDKAKVQELQVAADSERRNERNAAEAERVRAENEKYTFPVGHPHAFSYSFGHITFDENGAVYVGNGETIRIVRENVNEAKATCMNKGTCIMTFYLKRGSNPSFVAMTEAGVANATLNGPVLLPPSTLGNAVVARWGFVLDGLVLRPAAAAGKKKF